MLRMGLLHLEGGGGHIADGEGDVTCGSRPGSSERVRVTCAPVRELVSVVVADAKGDATIRSITANTNGRDTFTHHQHPT